jgi:thiamine kinase-like enzyme
VKPFDLELSFKNYVVKRLAPREEFNLDHCKLSVPLAGVKTFVRLLELQDGRGFIIRAFPRSKRALAHKLYLADDLLEKHNLAAPRLIDYATDFAHGKIIFLAEQYIAGRIIGEIALTDVLVRRLAELLCSLHSIKLSRWGDIARPKPKGYGAAQLRKIAHRFHGVRRNSLAPPDRKIVRRIRAWFSAWADELNALELFDLIHDKLNPGNLIVSADGKIFLVDFATVQYGFKAKDLAQLYAEVLRDDPQTQQSFESYYLPHQREPDREMFHRLYPFFHAYYHLGECATNAKRDYKSKMRKVELQSSFHKKFLHHWHELQEIVL